MSVVLGVAAAPVMADHGEPFGSGFGVTSAVGPAWPSSTAWWAGTCDLEAGSTSNGGVGTPPPVVGHCIDTGQPYVPIGEDPVPPRDTVWEPGDEPAWRLDPVTQAGSHPDATGTFWLNRFPDIFGGTAVSGDGDTRTIIAKLPPGIVGNPNAVPRCPSEALRTTPPSCHPMTQVGVATIAVGRLDAEAVQQSVFPVWNVEPRDGKTAELLVSPSAEPVERANIPLVAKARTDGDYGIDVLAVDVPGGVPLLGQAITIWGVPWAAEHDAFRAPQNYDGHVPSIGGAGRGGMPEAGLPDPQGAQAVSYDRSWGAIRPFVTLPTECDPVLPETTLQLMSWQNPTDVKTYDAPADEAVDGCADVDFPMSFDLQPDSSAADSATGLAADIDLPQNNDAPIDVPEEGATPAEVAQYVSDATAHWKHPDGRGRAVAHLDKAVVTLPEGVSVNPSGATGLAGCSDAQIGLVQQGSPSVFNDEDPFDGAGAECPAGSRIGTAKVFTPLLPGADESEDVNLSGEVVLGMPKSTDPQSGEMFRLFVVVRNKQRGLVAKIYGSAKANPATGQLTATFDKNPRVPFDRMELRMKGGQRGVLATQRRCGSTDWAALFTPWTAAHGGGGLPVSDGGTFTTSSNCGNGFSPTMKAGIDDRRGGAMGGTFSFRFARSDGEQWFHSLTARLPKGLLAAVRDVPLCTNAQAAAAACPLASRIGQVDAGAGSGTPFFLEKKGSVFLTEGYKGAPYGLSVQVPVEAGPFTGAFALSTVVVRQALHVDPDDASVTAVSDPFPQIWHGIPLRVREVTVTVDRPGFMRNPTDCSEKQIGATIVSTDGATANLSSPFQVSGCRALAFKPKVAMRLIGRNQRTTGKHPRLRVTVTQKSAESGITRAEAWLPKSLALDPRNTSDPKMLCSYEGGLAGDCPAATTIGFARAESPLLKRPLSGPVHLVQGIRFSSTGNRIRTLPTLLVKLRGEVTLNLRGTSDTKRGFLISTFDAVPDAPVSSFGMRINGGKKGILAVTRTRTRPRISICDGPQVTRLDFDGHNGRRSDIDVTMKAPCAKKKAKGGKARSKRR
jgi:hypothetical protein